MKKSRRNRYRPSLRFSPYAWAKLLFLRDQGPTEIGGFGIAREGDPLLVEDIAVVQQCCTAVTMKLDDLAVADFFDRQIDLGRRPEEFARVWIHTHPGESAQPSRTDEKTFSRVFGKCDWAVMAILARGGESYARLRFNTGPKADVLIGAEIDWSRGFPGSSEGLWRREYLECIRAEDPFSSLAAKGPLVVDNEPDQALEQAVWEAAFW